MRTVLLLDDGLDVKVDQANNKVAGNVDGANGVENLRVFERNALGDLHHTQHDDEVGATSC